MSSKQVIILGGSGHAKVCLNVLRLCKRNVIGFTAPDNDLDFKGVSYLGNDNSILDYDNNEIELVNGIGMLPYKYQRKTIFENFKSKGYSFTTLIHPMTIIADDVQLSEGVQVMAGAVIQPATKIGANTIVNTQASIDHDCNISDHCHIAPGARLSGGVTIGAQTHIGTNATIIENMSIGDNSIIAAGATVYRSIPDNCKYISNKEDVMSYV